MSATPATTAPPPHSSRNFFDWLKKNGLGAFIFLGVVIVGLVLLYRWMKPEAPTTVGNPPTVSAPGTPAANAPATAKTLPESLKGLAPKSDEQMFYVGRSSSGKIVKIPCKIETGDGQTTETHQSAHGTSTTIWNNQTGNGVFYNANDSRLKAFVRVSPDEEIIKVVRQDNGQVVVYTTNVSEENLEALAGRYGL